MFKLTLTKLLLLFFLLVSCSNQKDIKNNRYNFSGKIFGTTYSVILVTPKEMTEQQNQAISDNILNKLNSFNDIFSTWQDDSEISTFNKLKVNQSLIVDPMLIAVLERAFYFQKFTNGNFNIAMGELSSLWSFKDKYYNKAPNPDKIKQIENKMKSPSIIKIENNKITKLKNVSLDLSAIAKGKAVDFISNYLIKQGYPNHLVEIGGEIIAKGYKEDNNEWNVAIQSPAYSQDKAEKVIKLKNLAIATSGDYRNYHEVDGVRVTHILNPNTGHPINNKLASVSIITENAIDADALATAIMVMGEVKGFDFASKNNLMAYFIIKDKDNFKIKATKKFINRF